MKNDDTILISRILSGHAEEFDTLVKRYERLVCHVVFRLIHDPQEREDVCQDVFLKVFQHLKTFRFQSKLSTWIAQIAYRTTLNVLRKQTLPVVDGSPVGPDDRIVVTEDEWPDHQAENRDLLEQLDREIRNLPLIYRTVVTLYHQDHLTYEDIARIVDLPLGTVKNYMFRARKQLKERLEAYL
jgi:RNA polymerase sigma-70 factor (ECF subfamily)